MLLEAPRGTSKSFYLGHLEPLEAPIEDARTTQEFPRAKRPEAL